MDCGTRSRGQSRHTHSPQHDSRRNGDSEEPPYVAECASLKSSPGATESRGEFDEQNEKDDIEPLGNAVGYGGTSDAQPSGENQVITERDVAAEGDGGENRHRQTCILSLQEFHQWLESGIGKQSGNQIPSVNASSIGDCRVLPHELENRCHVEPNKCDQHGEAVEDPNRLL